MSHRSPLHDARGRGACSGSGAVIAETRPAEMNQTFRILVIRLSSMGDVIHALPAVASLKHSFPESRVSWVIKSRWQPRLAGNPFVDEVIPFERTARGVASTWRRTRRERFDVAVDFQGLIQSALLATAARAE